MESTIEIFDLLKWLLLPGIAALLWLIWKFRAEHQKELEKVEERHKSELEHMGEEYKQFRERTYKRIDQAHEETRKMSDMISAWQLEMVRTYATKAELDKVVAQISVGFEKIEARLDRYFTKGSD